jgi:hypothetical protein
VLYKVTFQRKLLTQDAGPATKKPVRLGSVSPAHTEPCKDLKPFVDDKPDTPELDPTKDDYKEASHFDAPSCLEQAEFRKRECAKTTNEEESQRRRQNVNSTRSPPSRGSATSDGDVCDKPLKTPCNTTPVACGSARLTKAVCSPIPENHGVSDVKYTPPPFEVPESDVAYAFTNLLDKNDLDQEPAVTSPCTMPSPFKRGSHDSPMPSMASNTVPDKCKFRDRMPCSPVSTTCQPLYGYTEFSQPATEGSHEYLTEPMRLAATPPAEFQASPDTVFGI